MKKYAILTLLFVAFGASANLSAQSRAQLFTEAQELYNSGVYGRAAVLFDKLSDPLSKAYSILCATKLNTTDHLDRIASYSVSEPKSILSTSIHFSAAQGLFNEGSYQATIDELSLVDLSLLSESEQTEAIFKKGYSFYALGNYNAAIQEFVQLQSRPYSVYSAPSCYYLGYIAYNSKDFEIAALWFGKTLNDSRFSSLSEYYLMECRFMGGDYAYIAEHAPAMLDTLPSERQGRLARMLSEAYLVRGNNQKALEYLQKESKPDSRVDFFHAGSVLYAVGDYKGAIDNFSRMENRTDSIGQIANYDLGYSYIRTGNKVSAAEAFKAASNGRHNAVIEEDAAFNHAKLSFDLNGDTTPFEGYIRRYSTEKRGEQIYNYMAIGALNKRDYAVAIDNYSKIEELDDTQMGNYVKANYLRAQQLISSGAWSSAIPFLKASGFYYPKTDRFNQLSRYWLAEAYYNSGDFAEAASVWEELYNTSALRNMEEGALLTYNIGYASYSSKKFEQAARWFDIYAANTNATKREEALLRRADCDFARRDYTSAVASYQRAIEAYGSADKLYPVYQQGLAYGLSGQNKQKVEVLQIVKKASPKAPLYSESLYELGRSYLEEGLYNQAAESFELLRSSTSDNTFAARALIGKGMAYRNIKSYDKALDQYKQVVSLVPGSEYAQEALLAINSIYQTAGTPEKYIEYIESNGLDAGSSAEEKEAVYFNTAEQIYLTGNYSGAINYLLKFIADYPKASKLGDAYFYLADSYKRTGEKEKACACFAQAVQNLGEGSFAESAALGYASLSFDLGHFEDAVAAYEHLGEVAQMSQNQAIARMGLLRSAYSARNWELAVKAAAAVEASEDPEADKREALFTKARAYLAQSQRAEAFDIFTKLAAQTTTAEGAESAYMLVQDSFDRGNYDNVEAIVYKYASEFADQAYWLARCYIVLADTFAAKGNTVQAKATFESIRDGYVAPGEGDDIARLVSERLNNLQ